MKLAATLLALLLLGVIDSDAHAESVTLPTSSHEDGHETSEHSTATTTNDDQCVSSERGDCPSTSSQRQHQPAANRQRPGGNDRGHGRRCGLYLSRSTIPNSGLGVFAGEPHEVGSVVAPPEIAHQIILRADYGAVPPEYTQSLAHDYAWSAYVTGGSFEAFDVESLVPGLGMAANSFLPLINSRSVMGPIDSAGINDRQRRERIKGPGSGAFSYYYGTTYVADRKLEAGSELFVDYGDSYFRHRPQVYGMVPLQKEFEQADEMMTTLWEALPPAVKEAGEIGPEWQAAWDAVRHSFVQDERLRNALPASVAEISRAAAMGTPHNFLRGENPRSLEWLESNGFCMDHLDVRTSTIAQAGRGAFAKRKFAVGETVLPLPLLQIPRRMMNLYRQDSAETAIHSRQLLLNYCLGHRDSSLLLLPYSSTANFINHGGGNANAKLVWARSESDPTGYHQDDWMDLSPKELLEKRHAGFLMLLIATRDIAEGEEVKIDYGSDWQQAWRKHVKDWPANHDRDDRESAAEYNQFEGRIRTVFEDSYPPTVGTACHYRTNDAERAGSDPLFPINPNEPKVEGDNALHLELGEEDLQQLKEKLPLIEQRAPSWIDYGGRATISGDHFRPCTVVGRQSALSNSTGDADVYTVRMYNRRDHLQWDSLSPNIEHYVKNVPRRAILFVDLPHTSDQHSDKAFRQEIGFPDADAMWPDAWMDSPK